MVSLHRLWLYTPTMHISGVNVQYSIPISGKMKIYPCIYNQYIVLNFVLDTPSCTLTLSWHHSSIVS